MSNELDKNEFGYTVRPQNQEFIDTVMEETKKQGITICKRKVFCTDSLICEYSHLDFIKNTGAELIEMENTAFYSCMKLMEKNGITLLCVSDNSTAGISLVARTEAETERYHQARDNDIHKMITLISDLSVVK